MFVRLMIGFAGLCGALAVAMGSLHAHGLERLLEVRGYDAADIAQRMQFCDTANKYALLQAGALLATASLITSRGGLVLKLGGLGMVAGTLGFCGALYMLTFANSDAWGQVAPVGGITLILSWLFVAVAALVPHYEDDAGELVD